MGTGLLHHYFSAIDSNTQLHLRKGKTSDRLARPPVYSGTHCQKGESHGRGARLRSYKGFAIGYFYARLLKVHGLWRQLLGSFLPAQQPHQPELGDESVCEQELRPLVPL